MMKMVCISALYLCFVTENEHPKKDKVCCVKHDGLYDHRERFNKCKENHVLGQLYTVSPDFICRRDFSSKD